MTEPTRTSTGIAYLTYDATLNTDASMIVQQKLDLSGNTTAQTFCVDAFDLALGRDISGSLLTDSEITDYDSNNLVYLGSNDVNVQKTFLSSNINSTKSLNQMCNAYDITLGKNNQIPLVSYLEQEPEPEPEPIPEPEPEIPPPPLISRSYEYNSKNDNVAYSDDYPNLEGLLIQKYEIGKFYEIRDVDWETPSVVYGNDIDGFRNQQDFSHAAIYSGLLSESDVSKNLYIEVLGPVTEWPAGPIKNGITSKVSTAASNITHGYRFIDNYEIPQVYEVSFYVRSNKRGSQLSTLLFYDSSYNIIPTIYIEKTTNNIDDTINNLDYDRSGTGSEAIKQLINYRTTTKWYGGHYDYSTGNGTMKIKLWGQPVYYRFTTGKDNNNSRMITSWTMYDHTLNKISNEYFYNDEYYVENVPNYHTYPVDSSGNSSGYFSFNDNDFIDDIYDSSSKTKIQDSDSSFLVGRVYQLINLTGNSDSTLASGNNTSGFGSNDLFGSAVTKAGIIGAGSVGTAYIKVFSNIITGSTTNSKGFKFITNATFKSFDSSRLNIATLRYQRPKGDHNECIFNNSIYKIDNVTASSAGYNYTSSNARLVGNNDDGYHMYETEVGLAAIHSGVLTDGETGSVYIKCFDVLLNNFTGTISNGITSIDETEANGEYSFKIYSLP